MSTAAVCDPVAGLDRLEIHGREAYREALIEICEGKEIPPERLTKILYDASRTLETARLDLACLRMRRRAVVDRGENIKLLVKEKAELVIQEKAATEKAAEHLRNHLAEVAKIGPIQGRVSALVYQIDDLSRSTTRDLAEFVDPAIPARIAQLERERGSLVEHREAAAGLPRGEAFSLNAMAKKESAAIHRRNVLNATIEHIRETGGQTDPKLVKELADLETQFAEFREKRAAVDALTRKIETVEAAIEVASAGAGDWRNGALCD